MQKDDMNGATFCTSKAALAAGTTTTFSTTGATLYCIKGKAYSTAAGSNAATPTLDGNTGKAFLPVPINKGSVFVYAYDGSSTAANAIEVYQGTIVDLDAGGNFTSAPEFPALPDNVCPFAYELIQVASNGSAWTFGASNQSGVTGVTFTRQDIMVLPDRPQIS